MGKTLWNLTPAVVALLFITLLGWWTHGLKAFTSYSATLAQAGPLPRQAPPLAFIDATGRHADAARSEPAFRLVQFFYANCREACPLAMGRIHDIETALGDLLPTRVQIVSLSFDHDSPESLHKMWIGHGSPPGWTMGTLTDPHPEALLEALGVLVIRRDDGLINHSLDLYLIDSQGQVRVVFSPDDAPESIAKTIRGLL